MKASRMKLREQSEEDVPCGARSHTHGPQAIPVRDIQTACSVVADVYSVSALSSPGRQ